MERGHELYYEGCRKIDLIRFNKYYTLLKEAGKDPSSQYFPLPDYAVKQAEECGKTLTQYFTRDNYDDPKRWQAEETTKTGNGYNSDMNNVVS